MDESRKQFEEWFYRNFVESEHQKIDFENGEYQLTEGYDTDFLIHLQSMWMAWDASRQSQQVVAYLTNHGSAVSPDDFEGGEVEMHETAKREEWFPLVKKGE